MGWLDVPPSAGWTCLTPGVSFLKTLKRKTKTKVCNLDLAEMQDSQLPVLTLGFVGDHGAWVLRRRGLTLWFYSLSPVSSFGPVLVNLFFILLDLVTYKYKSRLSNTLRAFLVQWNPGSPGRSSSHSCARLAGAGGLAVGPRGWPRTATDRGPGDVGLWASAFEMCLCSLGKKQSLLAKWALCSGLDFGVRLLSDHKVAALP